MCGTLKPICTAQACLLRDMSGEETSMKKRKICVPAITGFAIATSLLFASCYWNPQSGTGSITLHISGPASRSITAPTSVSYARVFLYTDNGDTPVNVGESTPFAEATLSGGSGSVTVQNVPAGPQYKLVLVLGTKDAGSGVFLPATYSQTQSAFVIAANKENAVTLAAPHATQETDINGQPVAVNYDLLGKNLTGATVANEYWAASTSNTLFTGMNSETVNTSYTTTTPGGTINSLSAASNDPVYGYSPFVWVNSTVGILTYDPYLQTYSTSPLPSGGPGTAVLLSGSYYANQQDVVFYADSSSVGGTVYNSGSVSASWVTVPITGVSSPTVLDIAVPAANSTAQNAYFATKLGAFAISHNLLSSDNNTLTYLLSNAAFLTVVDPNGNNPFVNSLAIDPDPSSSDSTLLVGTNNGIYTTAVSAVDLLVGTGSAPYKITTAPLSDTQSHAFRRVVVGPQGYYSPYFWVGWSGGSFFYGQIGGTSTSSVPVSAVTLGTPRAIAIMYDSATYCVFLVIAGSEGLSFVPIGLTSLAG